MEGEDLLGVEKGGDPLELYDGGVTISDAVLPGVYTLLTEDNLFIGEIVGAHEMAANKYRF